MSLHAKKLELVQLILNTEKPAILKKVEEILKREKASDWWDNISEKERDAIEQGVAEADKGNLIQHEHVMNEAREKYKKSFCNKI
ncbi:MAG: hypothetical protein HOD63_12935 [Bacteroidetes bacterium]|jgi:predicted transcriptional regulator|nr:hypothetical protein [Bacteroidota bacterium]MBT5528873.1 hypothetical protein [Cytophagia bacterium]MBT3801547.1 hypothetical protein [Bacteroidota bacterium]MBT3933987.1 hypothetical protein [Bacteroidota bacterium]MBT4339492.1 hypothetical protein [Bacteroidota bacterium]